MIVLKHILVPTDFGPAAEAALRYGRTLASTFDAELHLLHVLDSVFLQARFADPATIEAAARKELDDRVAGDSGRRPRTHAVMKKYDAPADAIVRYARSAGIDLIVMGTHGHHGVAHVLMGSVAEKVVRSAPCPVLVVRHPEREFVTGDEMTIATTESEGLPR
jgi:nucleotide-binding universal stress UspA family protein